MHLPPLQQILDPTLPVHTVQIKQLEHATYLSVPVGFESQSTRYGFHLPYMHGRDINNYNIIEEISPENSWHTCCVTINPSNNSHSRCSRWFLRHLLLCCCCPLSPLSITWCASLSFVVFPPNSDSKPQSTNFSSLCHRLHHKSPNTKQNPWSYTSPVHTTNSIYNLPQATRTRNMPVSLCGVWIPIHNDMDSIWYAGTSYHTKLNCATKGSISILAVEHTCSRVKQRSAKQVLPHFSKIGLVLIK